MQKILIIHGPNLHLLGLREPDVYGQMTLDEINAGIKKYVKGKGISLKIFQSNCEGRIIDIITANIKWADFIIINPGAFTHYSYAIRDCIKAVNIPTIEVHLSDIKNREEFRKKSVIKDVVISQIYGKGIYSYFDAIELCLKKK
ncbi:MAG: type II 3-dehydroquinate dehydratase [Elusimicrobiales bacterium]|nr:type II 3-dehydroquinate dehydratase [Elusimicrobiales bacterium]